MKKIEAQVHMLPTYRSEIYKEDDKLYFNPKTSHVPVNPEPQHLYFTLDEEIKEGDWCLLFDSVGNLFTNKPQQYLGEKAGHVLNDGLRKVIASTDPRLTQCLAIKREGESCPENNNCRHPNCTVAQIPQSFIEEYCKSGGIDKVLVEYTKPTYEDWMKNVASPVFPKPKLNPDDTIVIHPVEENVLFKYLNTRERVLSSQANDSQDAIQHQLEARNRLSEVRLMKKWIKENL